MLSPPRIVGGAGASLHFIRGKRECINFHDSIYASAGICYIENRNIYVDNSESSNDISKRRCYCSWWWLYIQRDHSQDEPLQIMAKIVIIFIYMEPNVVLRRGAIENGASSFAFKDTQPELQTLLQKR